MQQKYGNNPDRAAEAMGQPSFADLALQLADAPDPTASSSRRAIDVLGPQMARWLQASNEPDKGEPNNQLPYDFAAGAYIARVTGAGPDHEPLWAKTIQSARRAFGRSYVNRLLDKAERHNWTEQRVQQEIDLEVKITKQSAVPVYRFWNQENQPVRRFTRRKWI
jgi:hypothetical protein